MFGEPAKGLNNRISLREKVFFFFFFKWICWIQSSMELCFASIIIKKKRIMSYHTLHRLRTKRFHMP